MNLKKTLLISLISIIYFSCNNDSKIKLQELMETTHQIIFYKDHILRVKVPMFDGECCKRIQLLNKKFEVVAEINCLEPYPSIEIKNDSLLICYKMFRSEMNNSIIKHEAASLGNIKLYYKYEYISECILGDDIYIDSIQNNNKYVTFYKNNKIVSIISLQKLFYNQNYFYYNKPNDSIQELVNLKPINKEIFVKFFKQLYNQN